MEKSRLKLLEEYKTITEFIILNYSKADVSRNTCTLSFHYIQDVAKFNYIIGRMENYLTDKDDFENFDYMERYFKNEFEERGYDWILFNEHLENNLEEKEDE
jgi:hypothetical protein